MRFMCACELTWAGGLSQDRDAGNPILPAKLKPGGISLGAPKVAAATEVGRSPSGGLETAAP